jgi:hypothetical protein
MESLAFYLKLGMDLPLTSLLSSCAKASSGLSAMARDSKPFSPDGFDTD